MNSNKQDSKNNIDDTWVPFESFLRNINKTLDDINDFSIEIGSYLIMKDISFEFSCFIKKEEEDVYINFPTPSSTHIDSSLCKIKIACGMLPNGISNNRINSKLDKDENIQGGENMFIFQE